MIKSSGLELNTHMYSSSARLNRWGVLLIDSEGLKGDCTIYVGEVEEESYNLQVKKLFRSEDRVLLVS